MSDVRTHSSHMSMIFGMKVSYLNLKGLKGFSMYVKHIQE